MSKIKINFFMPCLCPIHACFSWLARVLEFKVISNYFYKKVIMCLIAKCLIRSEYLIKESICFLNFIWRFRFKISQEMLKISLHLAVMEPLRFSMKAKIAFFMLYSVVVVESLHFLIAKVLEFELLWNCCYNKAIL